MMPIALNTVLTVPNATGVQNVTKMAINDRNVPKNHLVYQLV